MFAQYQALGAILAVLAIVLAPLVIGLVVALTHRNARRTIMVAAIVASALVFIGVALDDIITRLHGPYGFYSLPSYSQISLLAVYLSELLWSVGLSLSFAAVILGLRETARLRRWVWFVAFLLTQVASATGTTLFYLNYASYMLDSSLIQRFYEGNLPIILPYYLLTSLLLIAVPFATLLFAIIGIPQVETPNPVGPTQPAPLPQSAPPTAPYPPYPPTPPRQ
jgi:hypothetical protein